MKSFLSLSCFIFSHIKLITFFIALTISVIVLYQSMFYRWFGYETIPAPITDEFDYAWQGLSLRQYGLPVGWTILDHIYKESKYQSRLASVDEFGVISDGKRIDLREFQKDRRPLIAVKEIDYTKGLEHMLFVAPFFDHPPLAGLIYSLGVGSEIKEFAEVKPAEFRRPALILAIVTAVLLFIFICLITSNPWIAALAIIIYSTVPTYLLATRTAFAENVEPPFILTHLIVLFLAVRLHTKQLNKWLILSALTLSGLIGGLAFLVKEPAIGFLIGSVVLLLINKLPKRYILVFLFALLIPIGSYFIWGLWLQTDLFLGILQTQTGRGYFGAIKLITMLEALKFKNFPVDGWWIWGFLSFLLISIKIKHKNFLFLLIPLFSHFLLVLLLSSSNYPWYLISMIPFLAGCSAILIWQIYEYPTIATAYAFFYIPFSSSYYWGRVGLGLEQSITHYRYAFIIFSLLLILRIKLGRYRIVRIIWFIFLVILIQKIITFNQLFMPYLISHWGNLPIPSLPNF